MTNCGNVRPPTEQEEYQKLIEDLIEKKERDQAASVAHQKYIGWAQEIMNLIGEEEDAFEFPVVPLYGTIAPITHYKVIKVGILYRVLVSADQDNRSSDEFTQWTAYLFREFCAAVRANILTK